MDPPGATGLQDVVGLTKALLGCASITPARGRVFDLLEAALIPIGFAVDRFMDGAAPDGPVENMLAVRGGDGLQLAFAGHLDVVPPGDGWTSEAFAPTIRANLLYGRGAVDMKGAIAAIITAAARSTAPLVLILTGDEEGPATFGTRALIARMAARGIRPDYCLVGEPTSTARVGDTIKIGRRGSVNLWITVDGRQGHVAYPALADNPIPRLVAILAALDALVLDDGSAWFEPSSLAMTDLEVGNPATNVIPSRAAARVAIRFNDLQRGDALVGRVEELVHGVDRDAHVAARVSGEAFLTRPGPFSDLVAAAVRDVAGVEPALSTSGGTSDARFLVALCPVVELGLVNATMHQIDEAVAVTDLATLTDIYAEIIARVAASTLNR